MRIIAVLAIVLALVAAAIGGAYVASLSARSAILAALGAGPSHWTQVDRVPICDGRAQQCDFARAILGSLEDVWLPLVEQDRLRAGGGGNTRFDTPTLVVFDGFVETGCGEFTTLRGPFYCTADRDFYIDLAWLDDLSQNAPGDMGQAVIIAHEYAHWLQEKSGIGPYVQRFIQYRRPRAAEMSVRYELQADCLAGVWGSLAKDVLAIDDADLREAIGVASHIGDDAIQRRAGHPVDPTQLSHGNSEQRIRWMRRGFESNGDPAACDTFNLPYAEL